MAVDRCACHNVTFAELLDLHRAEGLGFDALCERTDCATGCTACEPYIRLTLETGVVDHPVLDRDEADAILARSRETQRRTG